MGNTILAKGVNHILAKRDNSAWPKGSKLSGFSIRNLPAPGEDSTDLIVYEPAEKGYKDWNEQLLAKIRLQESVHEEPARREEPEQERQARFHR